MTYIKIPHITSKKLKQSRCFFFLDEDITESIYDDIILYLMDYKPYNYNLKISYDIMYSKTFKAHLIKVIMFFSDIIYLNLTNEDIDVLAELERLRIEKYYND
ncbi:MAG: hypothetical protein HZC47_01030 [Methanobacterium sp.]|nr:hypothetical protein [Methanobacterium sp.]